MKLTHNKIVPQRLVSFLPPLRAKAVFAELRLAIQPYLFYWDEWLRSEHCNLDEAEVYFITAYVQADFTIHLSDLFMPANELDFLSRIVMKLQSGFQVFKEFVILTFLTEIIRLGKLYGNDSFYDSPLSLLSFSEPLKAAFRAFEVFCVRQLFYTYNVRQLNSQWVYDRIVSFHLLLKSGNELLTHKSHANMINSQ